MTKRFKYSVTWTGFGFGIWWQPDFRIITICFGPISVFIKKL